MANWQAGILFLAIAVPALPAARSLPLYFEANQGQTDRNVKFLARTSEYTLFLTANEAVFAFHDAAHEPSSALRMRLLGTDPAAEVTGVAALDAKSNYFIGSNRQNWLQNIPAYAQIKYTAVYPGIDLIYYGQTQQLEYDFAVAAGADPRKITLDFQKDAQRASPHLESNGDLVIAVTGGEIRLHKPVVYQLSRSTSGPKHFVDGRYVLRNNGRVGFTLGSYDRTSTLIIDPVLTYSTYLGGSDDEGTFGIKFDAKGYMYVAGETSSINFPVASAVQDHLGGSYDGFISKFDHTGSHLIYSTYLGGSAYDHCASLAVDASGTAYVTGVTQSPDFPTVDAFQPALKGSSSGFVSHLDATGSKLLFSSFLGGSGNDQAADIALDSAGDAYLTGFTNSTDFPVTPGAYQKVCDGGSNAGQCFGDAFVTKVRGPKLVYSTYLGGTGTDGANGIAVDRRGSVYITGQTSSTDFPLRNPFQKSLAGPANVFLTKLDPAGCALEFSTYLGGNSFDAGNSVALDAFDNAYITGFTGSSNFPLEHPYQSKIKTPGNHGFVTKFASTGERLIYSTYLGGSGFDFPFRISVDALGDAVVIGFTSSTDFPVVNALQPKYAGGATDAFITKFNPSGCAPEYSTYLGGKGDEYGYAINADIAGNVWVGGSTSSRDYPLVHPYQSTYGGGPFDAFLTKVSVTPAQSVQVLAGAIANLVLEGLLNATSAITLITELQYVAESLKAGDLDDARSGLERFCEEVDKLVHRGQLAADDGAQLCSAERDILDRVR